MSLPVKGTIADPSPPLSSSGSGRSCQECTEILRLTCCGRSVECQLNVWKNGDNYTWDYDLTPLPSFAALYGYFNFYTDFDLCKVDLMGISEDCDGKDRVKLIVDRISSNLNLAIYSKCMKCGIWANPYVDLCWSMIGDEKTKDQALVWCWMESESQLILIEIPLFVESASFSNQYFLDTFEHDKPLLQIVIDIEAERFEVSLKPTDAHKFSTLASLIKLPPVSADTLLGDYLEKVRMGFIQSLLDRKVFVEELSKISCISEFNPVDFSFVSILVRLRCNKLFTLFLVYIRIQSSKFPKFPPVVTIHDLVSSNIILVENGDLETVWKESDSMRIRVTKMFILICDLMNARAFPSQTFEQQQQQKENHRHTQRSYNL